MSATKRNTRWGLLGKAESVYGTPIALSPTTDGILVIEQPLPAISYAHDGARAGRYGMIGNVPQVAKSGGMATLSAVQEGIGAGAAYSASAKPSVYDILKLSGHNLTLTTTAGSEKYAATPLADSDAYTSYSLDAYVRGQRTQLCGVYGDSLEIAADAPGAVPKWTMTSSGILVAEPTDLVLPAITYPLFSKLPPKFAAVVLTIGPYSPKVKGFTFTSKRDLQPRNVDNTGNMHGGFTPGNRDVTFELTVEADALSAFGAYAARQAGTVYAISMGIGATQYNRWTLALPNAQLVNVEDVDDGPSAQWKLTFKPYPSTFGAGDEYSITFD